MYRNWNQICNILYSDNLIYSLYVCTCVFLIHQEFFNMILDNNLSFYDGGVTHLEANWFSRGGQCHDWRQQRDSTSSPVSIPAKVKVAARPTKCAYVREGKREERIIDVIELSSSSTSLSLLFYLCSNSATMYSCQII
jgi:hypothetical protein